MAEKKTTRIKLTNRYSKPLVVTSSHLDAGTWTTDAPSGSLAPGGTVFWMSENQGSYPEGFVNIGIEKETNEWVLVWWAGPGARAVSKNGAPRGTHRPKLYAEPQEWTRSNEDEDFEVVVLARPKGGAAMTEVCVAPLNKNCVTIPQITSLHRVMRANEDVVIEKFTEKGVDRNAWVVAGQPLRVKAIVAKPGDVSWSVRVTSGGKTEDAPGGSWHSNQDKLKLPNVSPDWEAVRIEAQIGNEVRASVVRVALCGVSRYIALVKKLEAASKQPSEWILNCLRGIARYDSPEHDAMMGVGAAPPAAPYLSTSEIADLRAASAHGTGGQTVDLLGKDVAIGHVITGLNAGLHRNKAYEPVTHLTSSFDNLWGETLGGDLGQSAVLKQRGTKPNLVGPLSGSEYSELNADLDGLALGDGAAAHLKAAGDSVSGLLESYYITAPNAPSLSASRRIRQTPIVPAALKDQATAFAFAFSRHGNSWRLDRDVSGADASTLQSAVDAFMSWDKTELAKEDAVRADADNGDLLDKTEGYDP